MNLEEAIRIVDPATRREALYIYDPEERKAVEDEACHLVAITLQQNYDLLTVDELREMDGVPVWIVCEQCINGGAAWCILEPCGENFRARVLLSDNARAFFGAIASDYGISWFAYCRKPEEGE